MISIKNLKETFLSLNFSEDGNILKKYFPVFSCSLIIDLNRKKLIYPEIIKGRERNNNFDKPENFVAFECVNRLMEKGYRPEHIELERE